MRAVRAAFFAAALGVALPAHAQQRDLSSLSLEDLLNVEVVSASRKEQRASNVPAAVYVLTADDIRHSGMTTIPDLLRLVPGVEVAQINANKWAVTVRGFNAVYANKLLVLVDSRSIYNHLFSGVFWDTVDVPVEDIDRIEVVRGPGGSVWGANAVNGVINIVTRRAADTQGAVVHAAAGTFEGQDGGIRYGGTTKGGAYRVFAHWSRHEPSVGRDGADPDDRSRLATGGFRLDGSRPAGAYTVWGGVTDSQASTLWKLAVSPDPAVVADGRTIPSHNVNANLSGRWTTVGPGGLRWQTQSSIDVTRRTDSNVATGRNAVDADTEVHFTRGRHDIVSGAGYRLTTEWATQRAWGFSLDPARQTEHLVNVYAQDEITLATGLSFTGGAKIEYSNEVGVSVQPTARALWTVTPKQRVWTSVSRAIRTPSLTERSGVLNFEPSFIGGTPMVLRESGNPQFVPETLVTAEAGYRYEASQTLTADVAVFTARYWDLGSDEPGAPFVEMTPSPMRVVLPIVFDNRFAARTMGLEAAAHWMPLPSWRMDASYTAFHAASVSDTPSSDPGIAAWDAESPSQTWQVRSTIVVSPRLEFGGLLLHAGPIASTGTPAYMRGDARMALRLTSSLVLDVAGQNLLSRSHDEMGTSTILHTTRIPRSARVRLTWKF